MGVLWLWRQAELLGHLFWPQEPLGTLADAGRWLSQQARGSSESFRDLLAALPHLGAHGATSLVYVTMIYGQSFNRHLARFCSRARAVGMGQRLLLFTLLC